MSEPTPNKLFWELLDPLPAGMRMPKIERRIWDLLVLVSEQQVTETLGEIRLRRQDIHRKLLDTSLYAAVLRFVCHGRDLSDLSIVLDRVAGRTNRGDSGKEASMLSASAFAGGASRVPAGAVESGSPGANGVEPAPPAPFVGVSRRNTLIGRYRHGAVSKKLGDPARVGEMRRDGRHRQQRNKRSATAGQMAKQDRVKVRDELRKKGGGELRALMRQSDQRGVAGQFEMTLDSVRKSVDRAARGGRGIAFEEAAASRNITPGLVSTIKSPALKKRLLRHVKEEKKKYDGDSIARRSSNQSAGSLLMPARKTHGKRKRNLM